MVLGKEDRVKTSVYGGDFTRSQPAVRESMKREATIDFGKERSHGTSYGAQFKVTSYGLSYISLTTFHFSVKIIKQRFGNCKLSNHYYY